ncbi:hypothetical protein QLX67_07905 [Balneolaceae bacterium ANBcel3]|nr:hypothetical protein [Balneolaceae bacterium ANBcel3]
MAERTEDKINQTYPVWCFVLLWTLVMIFPLRVHGQVNFGGFVPDDENYAVTLAPLGGYEQLDFGIVFLGQGLVNIEMNSEDVVIVAVEAVRYLDVYVHLDAPQFLYLDGNVTNDDERRIPFSLYGAYANRGSGNTSPADRMAFPGHSARFAVFRRPSGPPRPPPTPPHSGYVPPRETAYIILYGDITLPSGLITGEYEAEVLIEVSYDI